MSGKGARRRPAQISEAELAKRWDAVFGRKEPEVLMCQCCEKPLAECKCAKILRSDAIGIVWSAGID